jgi:hypothetical protein
MLNFIDRRFNSDKTSQYKLSIQISLDGFLFCVSDAENICIATKSLSVTDISNIESLFASDPLLAKEFLSAKCIAVNQKSTLVPSSFFDENKSDEYLKFVCTIDDDEKILVQKIKKLDAHCIFAVDENIYETVKKYQPQAEFYNQSIPLISEALSNAEKNIFVLFNADIIDIVAAENEKLLLHNSYKTESIKDAIYFTAAVKTQLNIEPDNIFLSGKVTKADEEKFVEFFKQTKLEINKNLLFKFGSENALLLLLLEKLHTCE